MSPDEAARRRDFTINAVAWDPLDDTIVDPFAGLDDLARGVLRMVDQRTFADDSLRVLRALQFSARFGLSLEAGQLTRAARSRSTTCRANACGARSRSC